MDITDKPQHPSRPAEGVHLSWLGILKALNIEPSEATVDFMGLGPLPVEATTNDSDAVYVLYKESLQRRFREGKPSLLRKYP